VPPGLQLLLTGVLFASGGAMLKLCEFPSLQRAGLRAAIAAIALFSLLPEARRRPTWRMLRIAPAYFGATVLFVIANAKTTAANAIFLQSTAPLWLVLLGPLLLRERATARDLLVLAGIAGGMVLFFVAPAEVIQTAPDPRLGDWFAIASGLSYALLLLGLRWLARSGGEAAAAIAWGNLLTCPIALLLMPVFGQDPIAGSARDWLVIGYLGVFQVGLAYTLMTRAIAHVTAVRAALLAMIEPPLNALLAWLVHGEVPHWLAAAGGMLIMGTVVAAALLAARAADRN